MADQKGFFKEAGSGIELVELASLADVTRVFEQGRLDGMASTMIETVEVVLHSDNELEIALVTDFSNGSDIIVANQPIKSIADLKGKKVGVELGLLGSFIMEEALRTHGLSHGDVELINVEQLTAEQQLLDR